jgi:hypothetical protein
LEEQRCSCSLCSSQGASGESRVLDPGDEDAGPTTWVAPAAPRGMMAMIRHSLKTEDRTVRREPSSTVGRKHLRPTMSPWTRPSESPTGSRPCGVQEQ